MKRLLLGNEAIGLGAMRAGVDVVTGYPGTPSSEILETVAKNNDGSVYVEWSVNEKAALEVAAGAAYAGARAMVTMKQVGLNVASDPLMSLNYVGVRGSLVVVVADDPGPISSQTEQDTRHFARFAKLALFDPSTPEEAYTMIADAFALSAKYGAPVLFRPTTRVCHSCSAVEMLEDLPRARPAGFEKSSRWVIFPKLSYTNHIKIEENLQLMRDGFSTYDKNYIDCCGDAAAVDGGSLEGAGALRKGIAAGGVSYTYVREALREAYSQDGAAAGGDVAGVDKAGGDAATGGAHGAARCKLLKVSTVPFPDKLALEFLDGLDEALVVEDLDPVIEDALIRLCGLHNIKVSIQGKLTGHIQNAGENTVDGVDDAVRRFLGKNRAGRMSAAAGASRAPAQELPPQEQTPQELPPQEQPPQVQLQQEQLPQEQPPQQLQLPARAPVLCAGCPHRASFLAVKEAAKGRRAIFCGDIGCYTLGNALPLEMVDTCLCMGAGITVAQGLHRVEPDAVHFAFIGDSTFFHSGITGIVNAVYNQADVIVAVLDNSTTAMTGNQPHPGTGATMMGGKSARLSIKKIVEALNVDMALAVDPFDQKAARDAVKRAIGQKGVRVLLFEAPCVVLSRGSGGSGGSFTVDVDACIGCKICIQKLGCPVLTYEQGKARIDRALCTGCGLCAGLCPKGAILRMGGGE